MNPKQRLRHLFNGYTEGLLTAEERMEFMEMVRQPEMELLVKELISSESGKESNMAGLVYEMSSDKANQIFSSILTDTALVSMESQPAPGPVRRMFWLRTAAAVLVIVLGTYFVLNHKEPVILAKKEPIDIAPGGNKAILTLANGSKIVLDSAQKGQLALQGNSKVIKTDSGKILYASDNLKTYGAVSFNTLATPRGGIYQITLPDGTSAWLNAASSITYPTKFISKTREVNITGEVYFEVAHDALHPFIVSTEFTKVEVLGTHFNVNDYRDDDEKSVRTTLLQGSVKVIVDGVNKVIKPGEQAKTNVKRQEISVEKSVDLDKVMAWRNGEMILNSGNVKQMMQEISRWYDVDIRYLGSVPDGKFFGSVNRNVPLSNVLEVLSAYGINTKIENNVLIVQ